MNTRKIRYLVAALITVALGLGVVAAAARSPQKWRPRPQPTFGVSLEDGRGTRLPTFQHDGSTWVQGEDGQRFVITLENPTAERVEAVVSVDGRDALSGRVADFDRQRGYIVPPFGTVRVEGFRQSLDRVATFRFTAPGDSYSAKMGTPENVGVIGVAFFKEGERDESEIAAETGADERRRSPSASPAPAAKRRAGAAGEDAPGDGRLGTEFGESRNSSVRLVSFKRASSSPARIITLRYDDTEGLQSRGIDALPLERPLDRDPREPQAFPTNDFAQPPPRF
jgi:hypothetical protein